jgi:hypothetical protein
VARPYPSRSRIDDRPPTVVPSKTVPVGTVAWAEESEARGGGFATAGTGIATPAGERADDCCERQSHR